jgi:hypothetical protein
MQSRGKRWMGISIFVMITILFFRMGPVMECPPSVLAPPIPPWGTPSAAGVAGEHSMPPILILKEIGHQSGKLNR